MLVVEYFIRQPFLKTEFVDQWLVSDHSKAIGIHWLLSKSFDADLLPCCVYLIILTQYKLA